MKENNQKQLQCPDCNQKVQRKQVKDHVLKCKLYRKKYLSNIARTIDNTSKNNLKFLFAQIQILKEKMEGMFSDSDSQQHNIPQIPNHIQSKPIKKESKNQENNNAKFLIQKNVQKQIKKQIKIQNEKQVIYKIEEKNQKEASPFDKYLQKKKNQIQSATKKQQKINIVKKIQEKPEKQNRQISYLQSLFQKQNEQKANFSQLQNIECSKCRKRFSINQMQQFVYGDLCLHPLCKKCIQNYLNNEYIKAKGKYKYPCPFGGCNQQIPYYQLAEIFGKQKMEEIQNQLMSGFVVNLIACVKCKSKFQFLKGRPGDAPKVNQQGKKYEQKYLQNYASFRFLCPDCKTQQCKSCLASPYHIGKTCQEYKISKNQKKCRYCVQPLPLGYTSVKGIKAFDDICDKKQCYEKTKFACSKINKCGHSCFGFIKQRQCLPCLKEKCALEKQKSLNGQNQDSYCNICYIEGLGNGPCIKIKCGHIFHYQCLQKKLKTRWFGPRILFSFCHCPLCKQWIDLPIQCELNKILQPYRKLQAQVKQKAVKRLKHEGEDKSQKLTDPSSQYFKQQQKYAMAIYAYFQCFKCKQPYFGGRKSCADAMNDNRQGGQQFKSEQLVCPQCCPISITNCKKHGKQFINFKCKFCCSVAQWFCWGSTHFCDSCHKRQVAGQYLNKIDKAKLPQCQGPGKCPSGGNHDGNGQTKSLGCSLCINIQSANQNF